MYIYIYKGPKRYVNSETDENFLPEVVKAAGTKLEVRLACLRVPSRV